MRLSDHFTLAEMTKSIVAANLGLNNTPDPGQIEIARMFCNEILEPIREIVGKPIVVNSGIRQPKVNAAVGGHPDSRHLYRDGWAAADIECPGISNRELANTILLARIPFDTLILEHHNDGEPSSGWVHIAWRHFGQRGRVRHTKRVDGEVKILPGLGGRKQ